MSFSTAPLSSDFATLRAFAMALQADNQTLQTTLQTEIAARDAELYANTLHIEKLKAQLALLAGCRGFLHADAYVGFNNLYRPDPPTGTTQLIEVACWAHAHRKVYEVHVATKSPAAQELLEHISALFAVETDIGWQSPQERLTMRIKRSVPLLAQMKQMFERTLNRISGKSTLAQAIRYSLSRWVALTRYTTDGKLEISNNAAERAIRPPAIGRKNWLFAGSDTGGQRDAPLYTIIETAKLNGINPEAYLRDIITRLTDHPAK